VKARKREFALKTTSCSGLPFNFERNPLVSPAFRADPPLRPSALRRSAKAFQDKGEAEG
jgi:hypothetical protein